MFSHIGSVLPSSLSEFSKTITNSIASQLNISRSINPAAAKDTEEEDADAPPEIDVDVLLSYYARLGEHRPCSRLLRERMFEHSNKGPRSATLLVPGSPTFERPWRSPDHALRHDDKAQNARNSRVWSRPVSQLHVDPRPKTAIASMSRRHAQGSDKRRQRSSNSSIPGLLVVQKQQQAMTSQHSQTVAAHGVRCSPEASSSSSSSRLTRVTRKAKTDSSNGSMQPLPQLHNHGEGEENVVPPVGIAVDDDRADTRRSAASIARGQSNDDAEHATDKHHRRDSTPRSVEGTTDETLRKRPSTAPSAVYKSQEPLSSPTDDPAAIPRVERGVEDSTTKSTASAELATFATGREGAGQPPTDNSSSHRSTSSAESGVSNAPDANRHDGSLKCTTSGPQECDTAEETPRPVNTIDPTTARTTTSAAAAVAADQGGSSFCFVTATEEFDTELCPLPTVSLRPATAEAPRRTSIEAVAALSRSSRLPPPSCSVSLGTASGFTTGNGKTIGGDSHGSRTSDNASGRRIVRGAGEPHYQGANQQARTEGGTAAGVGVGVGTASNLTMSGSKHSAATRPTGPSGSFGWNGEGGGGGGGGGGSGGGGSGSNRYRKTMTMTRRRPRRRQVGRGGIGPGEDRRQEQEEQRSLSAPGSSRAQHLAGGGRGTATAAGGRRCDSPTSPSAALVLAVGTAWTHWRRTGDLGELDARADPAHGRSSRGKAAAAARTKNGTVTGAGWGGNEQIIRMAASRMSPGIVSTKQPDEHRSDSREQFYDAPVVDVLKAFHPCVRCFDVLMRYFRDGMDTESLGGETSWSSPAAAGDPHVAFFVRWESLDKRLGRYIPRGFAGSFTPRPFRPALAEYAVTAAEDPKFWGLGWAQIPDTRCTVIVVKSIEVAAHERDWLSNRHGLILSFQDAAERHYQSVIFPETICKAGWNKERTIDALYRKAGYWKPRGQRSHAPSPSSTGGSPGSKDNTATGHHRGHHHGHDPVVARTAVFLRFETVTFRLEFGKYRRVKAAEQI